MRRRQRIASANVPRRYFQCRLANFDDRGGRLKVPKVRVQQFVDQWMPNNGTPGLLLIGGCGVGKTHLAVATLQEIIDTNKPGKLLFSNFQDLLQEIQASFTADSSVDKSELLRPLLEADLLVLDELGSQKPSNWVHDILYYIINTRYNDVRTTIFTTNNVEDLGDRIGERLRSRLYEMTAALHLAEVSDYRKKI